MRGRSVNDDGSPVAFARVQVRPSDYLQDLISRESTDVRIRDTVTDAQGRFALGGLPSGAYRIEISGTESRGSIHDFFLPESGLGMKLDPDTLRVRGSIAGSVALDTDSQVGFVQVYGMERVLIVGPHKSDFVIGSMPKGVYKVRISTLDPFRREAVLNGVEVETGKRTPLGSVALQQEAKLSIRVDSDGIRILGLDSTNPVIFDNERWDNGPDNEYIWAKASAGSLNLRGNILTRDFHNGNAMSVQLQKARQELREARMAGFGNLPEMTLGAAATLSWPDTGGLEGIPPMPTAGSELIVAEARKATPEKPLLVLAGGALTTVANAWLTDPSIAPKMVVAGVYTYNMEPEDSVANYIVARKCRFVQWGRNYTWGGKPDTSLIRSIPPTVMGDRLRGFFAANTKYLPFGDMAPVAFLFRHSVWKSADIVKVNRAMEVQPASDINFDFVDIPESANDWNGYQSELYAALTDPRAYHPFALPGRLEAETYTASSKANVQVADSTTGNETVAYGDGGSTEHRIAAAASGTLTIRIHYHSSGGAKCELTVDHASAPAVSIPLPAASEWADAAPPPLALDAGEHVLNVTISGGTAGLDWIEFAPP